MKKNLLIGIMILICIIGMEIRYKHDSYPALLFGMIGIASTGWLTIRLIFPKKRKPITEEDTYLDEYDH